MHPLLALLYRLLVIAAAVGWFLWAIRQPHDPIPWTVVGIFVLLSVGVKRAGFRVAAEVTHSLVNVVDVGALLVLGPLSGAIVASVSSILHVQISLLRRGGWRWYDLLNLPFFDGAVKALLALAGGNYYLIMGGTLAPRALTLNLLLPLVILYLFWFSFDHLLWVWHFLISGGVEKARDFLRRISFASFLIELAPLPFSIAFAVSWVLFDPLLRLILLIGTVVVALVVRGFAIALTRTEERVEALAQLNKFGQALVLAQLDEEKLASLLFDAAAGLIPNASFELVLLDDNERPTPILPEPGRASHVAELFDLILPLLNERPNGRLLSQLSRLGLAAEGQRTAEQRPGRGGALLIPLMTSDRLLGIFAAESHTPYGLTLDDGRSLSILATQAAVALQNARHFRQEQWRVRQLQTIAAVSRKVASVIKLDDLFAQVVELVRATFGYYHVQIYLVEPENDEVVFRAGSGEAGRLLAEKPLHRPLGRGIIGWVAQNGEPLIVNDVSQEPRYIRDSRRILPETRAEMAVPLKIEARVLGVLDVQSDGVGDFDSEDLFTMTTLAAQIAVAIEDARLYVAQREAAWVTSALLQVAEALNPLFHLSEVLASVVRITPPLVGADAAVVYLWRGDEGAFVGAASHGLDAPLARMLQQQHLKPSQFPLLAEVREQNRLLLVTHAEQSPLVPRRVAELVGEMGIAAVPLQSQGDFVGVLLVGNYAGLPRLSDRRQALIAGIGQQAAVALQAAMLHAAQHEEAAITRDLLQVAEMIASRSELERVLDLVARLTVTLAEVHRCAIYRWEAREDALLPAEAYGFAPEIKSAWLEATLPAREVPALALLWDATEPILLGGTHPPGCEAFTTLFETETLVAMPLRGHGGLLGLLLVDRPRGTTRLSNRMRAVLTGVARQLSVAMENARLYEEALQNERRSQELVMARQIQGALLPDRAPHVPGYNIAGYWRPAREVAGDFYDYLNLSHNRLALTIADVADKGMGAALFMVLTRTALRESLWNEEDAGRAMSRTNALIAADVRSGMFLTAFLAILTPATGHIQAANAGHIPPLIYRAATEGLSCTTHRNLPMGILNNTLYTTFDFRLEPGDFMVLITDGLMDTTNPAGELYGLQRLAELVYAHRDEDAPQLINTILDAAIAHAAGEPFEDDLTLVVVRREG